MSIVVKGCDCRKPGFPKHTHTHPTHEDGSLVEDIDCEALVQKAAESQRHNNGQDRGTPVLWIIIIILLLLFMTWAKFHSIELESTL